MKTFSTQKIKFEALVVSLSIYSLIIAPFVKATEIVITDNGSGSSSEVAVQSQAETTATQTNTADVTNNVSTASTTGDNTASDNSGGGTSIQTGDISSQTSIENQVNTSSADISDCCAPGTNAEISGNGADSENAIDLRQSSANTVTVNQNATITNTISGYANTGRNEANYNSGGNTSISTGDIKVNAQIENGPVNSAFVSASGGTGSFSATVFGNGGGSANLITAQITSTPNVFINNYSAIDNFLVWEANTGENVANGNSGGNVSIETGNIDLEIFIKNFVNLSHVEVTCCEEEDPGDPPTDGIDDPGGIGGPSPSGSSGGFSGSSIPAGAEAGAGGAGILGLSDTSGENFQSVMFMIGLLALGLGVKLMGETLDTSASLAKRKKLS